MFHAKIVRQCSINAGFCQIKSAQYKAIYVQADGEIGQASDIVTLVCLP